MKLAALLLATSLALPAFGETVYTIPQGYTKVTIAPADGSPKLTSISATLLLDVEFGGETTIGAFTDNADPDQDTQALSVSGVTWAADEWTAAPHLAYIAVADDIDNADGIAPAEEAFLITANSTTGDLTVETPFDLTTKFPATTSIKIRKAHTVASILNSLSTGSATFQAADRAFVWNGSSWQSLRLLAGTWRDADSITTVVDNMVIFPDEGIFIQRTDTGVMTLTLFGEVPAAPQIATIEASGFLSSRFPVGTTLNELGLQDANWELADRVFIWDGSTWLSNRYLSGAWRNADAISELTGGTPITSSSAVFVTRNAAVAAANGSVTTPLPTNYNID